MSTHHMIETTDAAGTHPFTIGLGAAAFGTGELQGDFAKGAGWVINLAVAEWAIRRSTPSGTRRVHVTGTATVSPARTRVPS